MSSALNQAISILQDIWDCPAEYVDANDTIETLTYCTETLWECDEKCVVCTDENMMECWKMYLGYKTKVV